MSRRRFYVPRDSIREGTAALPPDQAHHLRNVLRLRAGDVVEVFDGEGAGYAGKVELRESGVFVCRLQCLPSAGSAARLILAAALIKSAKFEWMLQKTTELGVSEIIPLKTSRSDIQLSGSKASLRLERWDRIVKAAAKQCGRCSAPRVHKALDFEEFLSCKELLACNRLLFDHKTGEPWQPERNLLSDKTVLCVGPEGGWEAVEIEQAGRAGFKVLSLGPWTLRAETASVAAVAILQHQIHQLGK